MLLTHFPDRTTYLPSKLVSLITKGKRSSTRDVRKLTDWGADNSYAQGAFYSLRDLKDNSEDLFAIADLNLLVSI